MDRRDFLKSAAGLGGAMLSSPLLASTLRSAPKPYTPSAQIAFVKTTDRVAGVARAIDLLGIRSIKGKNLFIKPNYNSADVTPGSTHNDILLALLRKMKKLGATQITVGDRSGMGNTRSVMESKDVFRLAKELNVKTIVFDELTENDWELIEHGNTHWQKGFALPRPVRSADGVIQACCLKTHRYGGHFTLSLKNSVGLAAKYVPGDSYNYMSELHSSPHQRRMIAEINTAYSPDLVVLDGIEAFTTGGPDRGTKVNAQVILAGTDRVAIDAVGVALLRYYGTTPEVSKGKIFEQDQIVRAVELKLGVTGPEQIELVTDDRESKEYADKIRMVLNA